MTNGIDSTGVSVTSEEKASPRKHRDNNKVKSAYGIGHKKKMHPLMLGPGRPNPGKLLSLHSASKNNLSEFTQRIMSAKLLRVKQVQNQLNETQIQLNELINENRALRNMQKRQEGALKRYEGHQAELPQLIRSHNEEIRALKASNKIIKAQLRESNLKLRERENELEALKENYNKLKKLSTEKNLLEREKLQKKVEDLQDVIKEQEEKIQVLSRKILLESKNYRHHLNVEVIKHKETQKDLNSALSLISKLENQLIAKDRAIPSSKILLRRDNKAGMPLLTNKSLSLPPNLGLSEDNIVSRKKANDKNEFEESPDTELELLNEMNSSEETPPPTQDIFPEIIHQKKQPTLETATENTFSNSDTFPSINEVSEEQPATPKYRKTPLPKKSSTFSADLEMNAKMIAGTISEDMQKIEDLALKLKNSSSFENKSRLSFIYEEVKNNVSKFDRDITNQIISSSNLEKISEEDDTQLSPLESRRSVPKRKLEEENTNSQEFLLESKNTENEEEFSDEQQQKYETMTKTWNNLKGRIKEERKKAEEKMKELSKINNVQNTSESASSCSEIEQSGNSSSPPEDQNNMKKELRFINFTDDAYILQELEKTDKIFNKLKKENKKSFTKLGSSHSTTAYKPPKNNSIPKPTQQNVKSFRSESQREPQYLKDFQKEYQKQNLIKALKAIDVGKDPSLSNGDSEDSDSEKKKNFLSPKKDRNILKQINRLNYNKPNKDLLTELFGSNQRGLENTDNVKLECSTTTGGDE